MPDIYVRIKEAPPPTLTGLMAEARRRVDSGEYVGHIAYMSVVARPSD